MKKTVKLLMVWVLIAAFSPLFALAKWNWNWSWQWNWQWQWSGQQNQTSSEDCQIELPEAQDLSEYEAERLSYQYSEEMVARDAYNYFYSLYWVQTFQNIADSESKHMEAVKKLLDRYGLEAPTWYWELQDEFEALKAEWEKWLKEALEVWVKIEILDIDDIEKTIKSVDNNDIKAVFTNIWWGSYNHMRWFLKSLSNNWYTTDIDYSEYLSEEELNTKWWALKVKLAEKLESEWIELPEVASSAAIAEKVANSNHHGHEWKWKWFWARNFNNQNSWENQEDRWFFSRILSSLIFWK